MASTYHRHTQRRNEFDSDCQSAWLSLKDTFEDRISSKSDLMYALQSFGCNPTTRKVDRYWSQYCDNGGMSYDKFKQVMMREQPAGMGDLMRAFRKLDTNGDGYLTADELIKLLTKRGEKMTLEEVQSIIAEADKNGDGRLDYAEFSHMMLNTAEESRRLCKERAEKILIRANKKSSPNKTPKENNQKKQEETAPIEEVPGGESPETDRNDAQLNSSQKSLSLSTPQSSDQLQNGDPPSNDVMSHDQQTSSTGTEVSIKHTLNTLHAKSLVLSSPQDAEGNKATKSTSYLVHASFKGEDELHKPLNIAIGEPEQEGTVVTRTTSQPSLTEEESRDIPQDDTTQQHPRKASDVESSSSQSVTSSPPNTPTASKSLLGEAESQGNDVPNKPLPLKSEGEISPNQERGMGSERRSQNTQQELSKSEHSLSTVDGQKGQTSHTPGRRSLPSVPSSLVSHSTSKIGQIKFIGLETLKSQPMTSDLSPPTSTVEGNTPRSEPAKEEKVVQLGKLTSKSEHAASLTKLQDNPGIKSTSQMEKAKFEGDENVRQPLPLSEPNPSDLPEEEEEATKATSEQALQLEEEEENKVTATKEVVKEKASSKENLTSKKEGSPASSSTTAMLSKPQASSLPPLARQSSTSLGKIDFKDLDNLLGSNQDRQEVDTLSSAVDDSKKLTKRPNLSSTSEHSLPLTVRPVQSAHSTSEMTAVELKGIDFLRNRKTDSPEESNMKDPKRDTKEEVERPPEGDGPSKETSKTMPPVGTSMETAPPLPTSLDMKLTSASARTITDTPPAKQEAPPLTSRSLSKLDHQQDVATLVVVSKDKKDEKMDSPPTTFSAITPGSTTESLPSVTDVSLMDSGKSLGDTGNSAHPPSTIQLGLVYHPPTLTPPSELKSWHTIPAKGCLYLSKGEEDPIIKCHHYKLILPSATSVWIDISKTADVSVPVDVAIFLFKVDSEGEPTDLITFTQHNIEGRWSFKESLEAGSYALVPSSSGCWLKKDEEDDNRGRGEEGKIVKRDGSSLSLTEDCKLALKEVYMRIDLDSNGSISRTEFDFFQESANDEVCDDDTWQVLKENFEMTSDDELTLEGFYSLHKMTATDSEDGVAELWDILVAMGYNKDLALQYSCPFEMAVYTEKCEAELEIVDIMSCDSVEPALCTLAVQRGVAAEVKGCDNGLVTGHAYPLPHWIILALQNKTSKDVTVQVDCSLSTNTVHNQDSLLQVVSVAKETSKVVYHLMKQDENKEWLPHCLLNKIHH